MYISFACINLEHPTLMEHRLAITINKTKVNPYIRESTPIMA